MSRAEKEQGRLLAWSFSRWKTYEDCPRKAKYKNVDGLPDPSSPAGERGNRIHDEGKQYLDRKKRVVPDAFKKFPLQRLRDAGARGEAELAFDRKWRPTQWFAPNAWVRIKVDALLLVVARGLAGVVDYKTGKYRPDDPEYGLQLDLYAVGAFAANERIERARPELWFLDHAIIEEQDSDYERKDFKLLKESWEERVEPMFADTIFATKPGPHCRWCPYAASKGGPCDQG